MSESDYAIDNINIYYNLELEKIVKDGKEKRVRII